MINKKGITRCFGITPLHYALYKFYANITIYFKNQKTFKESTDPVTCLKAYVFNDGDKPPKTLIAIDTFAVPREDMETKDWEKTNYDLESCMGLLPKDAVRLARHLNTLLSAVFEDSNYLSHGGKIQRRKVEDNEDDDSK